MKQTRARRNEASLNQGWWLRSSSEETRDGAALSRAGLDSAGWVATDLPSTVLAALVQSGVYEDPFFGMNFLKIPGQGPKAVNFSNHEMPDDSPFTVPWWFRTEFQVPAEAGARICLQLDALNYRANLWLNGVRIADDKQLVGAYREFELDITEHVRRDGPNALAVEIHPPTTCDLALTWVDWNPHPPDKNMGLWRDVWLRWSEDVSLRAPQVRTRLESEQRAHLSVGGELVNRSGTARSATVRAQLCGLDIQKSFQVGAGETLRFEITPEDEAALSITDPELWWPYAMGTPTLHDLQLELQLDGQRSDACSIPFGIREFRSELVEGEHTLYRVNGRPLLIRGAGWATDLFLRRQPERDAAQLQYVKSMNLNSIRFEGMLERASFLEECDREGIVVISGWCCCDCWEQWDRWNEETHMVATESLRSQIRRVRHHASMISWWYGSDFPPPPEVERSYLKVFDEERWPNCYQSSAAAKPTEVSGPSGMKMAGPYEYVPPNYWLQDTERGGAFGFATEVCPGPAVPPIESLRKMMPEENLWPVDEVWKYHAGGAEFHNIDLFSAAIEQRYGEVDGVEQFAQLSQLICYEGQRAMFEGFARNKFVATGVVQWMLNNAWPSIIWHLYDYYLRPGGGYFGTQVACAPLHVMYADDDGTVVVVNDHAHSHQALQVQARLMDLDLETLHRAEASVDVAATGRSVALQLPPPEGDDARPRFLELTLADAGGQRLDRNFYWLARHPDEMNHAEGNWYYTPVTRHADLKALRALPEASLEGSLQRGEDGLKLRLENQGPRLAFFVQLRLRDRDGEDILPVVWSDNYVSLLPGQSVEVKAHVPGEAVPGDASVELSGLNMATRQICVVP